MGDRVNVGIIQHRYDGAAEADVSSGETIFLYSFYGGGTIDRDLAGAMDLARESWGSEDYAGRRVFNALTGGSTDPLDYGYSTSPSDPDHDHRIVDFAAGRVYVVPPQDWHGALDFVPAASYGLDEYVLAFSR